LFTEASCLDPQVLIGSADLELIEEDVAELTRVILSSVDQYVLTASIQLADHDGEADYLGPCADYS
jgi:hypothetical protein